MNYQLNRGSFGGSNQRPLQQHGQMPNTQMYGPSSNRNQANQFTHQQQQLQQKQTPGMMPMYTGIPYSVGANVSTMSQQQQQGGWPTTQQQQQLQHQQMMYAQQRQRLPQQQQYGYQNQPLPSYHATQSQQPYSSSAGAPVSRTHMVQPQPAQSAGRQRVDSNAAERKRKQDLANSFKAASAKGGKKLVADLLSKTDLELGSYVAHGKTERQSTSVFAPRPTVEAHVIPASEPVSMPGQYGMMQMTTQPGTQFGTQLGSQPLAQPGVQLLGQSGMSNMETHNMIDDFGDFQGGQMEFSAFSGPATTANTQLQSTMPSDHMTEITPNVPLPISTMPNQSNAGSMSFADLIPKDTIKGSTFQSNQQQTQIEFEQNQTIQQHYQTDVAGTQPGKDHLSGSIPSFPGDEPKSITESSQKKEISETDEIIALYGSPLPQWCYNTSSLPSIYRKICERCLTNNGLLSTQEARSILLKSSVPKETLATIWELCNRRTPGTLVPEELFAILALIALAQAGWTKLTISKLASCATPPIPEFPEYLFMEKGASVFDTADGIRDNTKSATPELPLSPVDPNDKYSVFKAFSAKQDQNLELTTDPLPPNQNQSSVEPTTSIMTSQSSNSFASDTFGSFPSPMNADLQVLTSKPSITPAIPFLANTSSSSYETFTQPISTSFTDFSSSQRDNSKRSDSFNQFVTASSDNDDFGDFQFGNPTPAATPSLFSTANCNMVPASSVDSQFLPNYANTNDAQQLPVNQDETDDFGAFESAFASASFQSATPQNTDTFTTGNSNESIKNSLNVTPFVSSQDVSHNTLDWQSSSSSSQSNIESKALSSDTTSLDDAFASLSFTPSDTSLHQTTNNVVNSKRDVQLGSLNSWLHPIDSSSIATTTMATPATASTAMATSVASSIEQQSTFTSAPIPTSNQSEASFAPRLTDADRYKALTGDVQDGERHVVEWTRCIRSAHGVFKTASLAIHNTTLSKEVKNEIVGTQKGKAYFDALTQIYCVVARLKTSVKYSALANSNAQLVDLFRRIEETWTDIQHSFDGVYSLPPSLDMNSCYSPDVDTKEACGVCLLSTNQVIDELSALGLSFTHLSYSGKIYHSTCANFWCNKVSSVLPALPVLASGLL